MAVKKVELKRYDLNAKVWDVLYSRTSSDITLVGEDITVIGAGIGALQPGNVVKSTDTVADTLKKLLQTRIAASYTQPTVALAVAAGTGKGTYEAGTTVTATVRSTFTKNDAGALTSNVIKKNNVEVATSAENVTNYEHSAVLGDETVTFTSVATYAEGAIKNDNLGDPSPSGHIAAGSKTSANIVYTGIRKGFYGSDTAGVQAPLSTSAEIRALTATPGAVTKGQAITATVPTGSTRFTLAFRSNIGTLAEVLYKESGNANITGQFGLTKVNVEGANAYTAAEYNVYTISWAQPTAGTMTFLIKI